MLERGENVFVILLLRARRTCMTLLIFFLLLMESAKQVTGIEKYYCLYEERIKMF